MIFYSSVCPLAFASIFLRILVQLHIVYAHIYIYACIPSSRMVDGIEYISCLNKDES